MSSKRHAAATHPIHLSVLPTLHLFARIFRFKSVENRAGLTPETLEPFRPITSSSPTDG